MRSTDLAITFFTTLTVLANVASLGIVGLAVAARPALAGPSGPIGHAWQAARPEIRTGGLGLAWLVAAVSMSGSLWFSEAEGFLPCRLCWFQRGCMYPLVVVLAVAALGARLGRPALERRARQLAVGLAGVGAAIASYHVLIERFPTLETGACDPTTPCALVWFERLGFITLPYMALSGFVLILTLLAASWPSPQEIHS